MHIPNTRSFAFTLFLSSALITPVLSSFFSYRSLPLSQSFPIEQAIPPLLPRDQSSSSPTAIPYPYPFPNAPSAALEGAGLPGGRRTKPTSPSTRRAMRIAHGTLMGLAFAFVLPLGAILLRALPIIHRTSSINAVHIHAAAQLSGYALAIAGLGTGIWLGLNVRYLDYAHTVIGMAVLGAMACQVGLGVWLHLLYQQHQRYSVQENVNDNEDATTSNKEFVGRTNDRGPWRWVGQGHMWLGRCLVLLGMINGGLGLELARNTKKGEIGYGVVAGVMGVGYLTVGCGTWWWRRR